MALIVGAGIVGVGVATNSPLVGVGVAAMCYYAGQAVEEFQKMSAPDSLDVFSSAESNSTINKIARERLGLSFIKDSDSPAAFDLFILQKIYSEIQLMRGEEDIFNIETPRKQLRIPESSPSSFIVASPRQENPIVWNCYECGKYLYEAKEEIRRVINEKKRELQEFTIAKNVCGALLSLGAIVAGAFEACLRRRR